MSLRRKSCNACYQGRRKCDLMHPTCGQCKRTNQYSQFNSFPMHTDTLTYLEQRDIEPNASDLQPITEFCLSADWQHINFDIVDSAPLPQVPSFLGELGDVQPLRGNAESWQWVIERLRECPGTFARSGGNLFIHPSTYSTKSVPTIKAAFGVCAASLMKTPATSAIFTSSLTDEANTLLRNVEPKSIEDELACLQAMVLYQILRFWSKDLKLLSAAQHQKSIINAWALQILQKLRSGMPAAQTLENWILAESVRRTVMVIFLLHALSSISEHGVCTELPTLALLPVSVNAETWMSDDVSRDFSAENEGGTMRYGEWTDTWIAFSPRRPLDAFQKLLMVACKGKSKIEELEDEIL